MQRPSSNCVLLRPVLVNCWIGCCCAFMLCFLFAPPSPSSSDSPIRFRYEAIANISTLHTTNTKTIITPSSSLHLTPPYNELRFKRPPELYETGQWMLHDLSLMNNNKHIASQLRFHSPFTITSHCTTSILQFIKYNNQINIL